jgi:hypothetical protein
MTLRADDGVNRRTGMSDCGRARIDRRRDGLWLWLGLGLGGRSERLGDRLR